MAVFDRRQDLAGWGVMAVLPLALAALMVRFDDPGGMFVMFFTLNAPILIFGAAYITMSHLRKPRRSVLTVSTGAAAAYFSVWYLPYHEIRWYLGLVP